MTDINALMAAALAADAGVSTESVQARVAAKETTKSSELATLLAQAASTKGIQPKSVGKKKLIVEAVSAESDDTRRRRNYDVPTRSIYVFTSETIKAVFISSNIMFDNKDEATQIKLCQRGLQTQKKPKELMAQEDLKCELIDSDIPFGAVLDQTKADLHDKYLADGWTMISNRPRIAVINPPVEVEADEVETTHHGVPLV